MRSHRQWTPVLGASLAVHVAAAWLGAGLMARVAPPAQRTDAAAQHVHAVDVVEPRPVPAQRPRLSDADRPPEPPEPPPSARAGDPRPRRHAVAADTLARARRSGSEGGVGRPRPSAEELAGDDLDDLRFRPYDHLLRDSPHRRRRRVRPSSLDNQAAIENPRQALARVRRPAGAGDSPTPPSEGSQPATERADARQAASESAVAIAQQRDDGIAAAGANSPQRPEAGQPARIPAPSHPAGQQAIERMTRIPKHGKVARAALRPEQSRRRPSVQATRIRPWVADARDRDAASDRRRLDAIELARASDRGTDSGKGSGSRAGRPGDPAGQRGLPLWLNTTDRRYVDFFRKIHRKIQPLWRFPTDLEVLMEQGEVLVQFTVLADGSVTALRVRKSSGFPRFDRNVVAAIQRAAPFRPIPPGLGPRIEILAPFEFHNPLVR